MSSEVAEFCGFPSMADMIVANLTTDELNDMLMEYIHEDKSGMVEDTVKEIASHKYEWVDHEGIKADHEDRQYQEYKDRGIDDE